MRVALFTDSFHETNGVGTFCREYLEYARQLDLPFLCVFGGQRTAFARDGRVRTLELRRGPLTFKVDADVSCDPALGRHLAQTVSQLRAFRPDLVHITGPGDVSLVGIVAAHIVGVPVMASWHTNLHEYAQRRLDASLWWLPAGPRLRLSHGAEWAALWVLTQYYRSTHFVAAPNREMVRMLAQRTGRPAWLIEHGVNTALFSPARRRPTNDTRFVIGHVGRLTPEKNVRALVDLEQALLDAGERDFRMLVVGTGSELPWLRAHLRTAAFTGPLYGDALATAFAGMDAFIFPSRTDTFGLVNMEAMASGVPVIAAPDVAPRAGVVDGVDGFGSNDFAERVRYLMHARPVRDRMGAAARVHAGRRGWRGVFDALHAVYRDGLSAEQTQRRMPTPRFAPTDHVPGPSR